MKISDIQDAIQEEIVARNCFIVEIILSKDNDIEIVIEKNDGEITLDDCVGINRVFEEKFDRNVEDYSLTVGSAGLDRPFKVPAQYKKAIGTQVEVSFKGGKRTVAELLDAGDDWVEIKYECREAVEGKKKKVMVEHRDRISLADLTAVRPHVIFE